MECFVALVADTVADCVGNIVGDNYYSHSTIESIPLEKFDLADINYKVNLIVKSFFAFLLSF